MRWDAMTCSPSATGPLASQPVRSANGTAPAFLMGAASGIG